MSANKPLSDNDLLLWGLHWDHSAPKANEFSMCRVGQEMSIRE